MTARVAPEPETRALVFPWSVDVTGDGTRGAGVDITVTGGLYVVGFMIDATSDGSDLSSLGVDVDPGSGWTIIAGGITPGPTGLLSGSSWSWFSEALCEVPAGTYPVEPWAETVTPTDTVAHSGAFTFTRAVDRS